MFDFILILSALLVAFYSAALAIDVLQKRRRRRDFFQYFDERMAELDRKISRIQGKRSLFQDLAEKRSQKSEK